MLQNNVRRLKSRNLRKLLRNSSDMRPVWAEDQSSAVFDFKNNRVYAKGKRWPLKGFPGFVASGGDNGTVTRNGAIVPATAPRIGDDGLLVEEARTNNVLHSGDLTNAAWGSFRTIKTTGDDAPKSGETYTLCEASETNANGSGAAQQNASVASGQAYTYSIYAKAGATPGVLYLRMSNSADFADDASAWFDVASGTIGTVVDSGASVSLVSGDIEEIRPGEYRCSITFTADAAITIETRTYLVDADAVLSVTVGKQVQLWGGQFEQGSFASSYIPTAGSTVTRSADSDSLTDLAALGLTSSVLSAGYTVVVEGDSATFGAGLGSRVLEVGDGTDSNRTNISHNANDTFGLFTKTGGASQGEASTAASTGQNKIAARVAENDCAISANGGVPGKDTTVTLPSVTQMLVGAWYGGAYLNGTISRLTIIPTPVSDAQLQALST